MGEFHGVGIGELERDPLAERKRMLRRFRAVKRVAIGMGILPHPASAGGRLALGSAQAARSAACPRWLRPMAAIAIMIAGTRRREGWRGGIFQFSGSSNTDQERMRKFRKKLRPSEGKPAVN
jgi:hypothetical protein